MKVSPKHCMAIVLLVLLGHEITNNAAADDKAGPTGLRVTRAAGNSRLRPYQPGYWGQFEVEVTNRNDRDARLFISSYFRGNSYRQFARRFWVPAGARRRTSQLMFLPKSFDTQSKSIGIESLVYDQTDAISTDRPLRDAANRVLHSNDVPRTNTQTPTAFITDPEIPKNSDKEFSLDLVEGCTFSRFRNRQVVVLDEDLPSTVAVLDSFQNIVLCSDRIGDDAAACRAVRRWVQRGGRIWIMLNFVKQKTVERLFGDASSYQEIDRVELTETQIVSDDAERWGNDPNATHHDRPVKLVRVLVENATITHTVGGWPAAFQQEYGRGHILHTTLGPNAWARRPNQDPEKDAGVRLLPKAPLEQLSGEWFQRSQPSPIRIEAFKDSVTGQIGYQVVDRKIIIATLGAFGFCLIAVMFWLWRRRRPELMLAVGPGLALIAGGILVFLGSRSRHSAPDMTAIVQYVDATNDSEDVVVTGLMGVYRQDDSTTTIGAKRGGLFDVDAAEQTGTTRQMVWTDFDSWTWSNQKLSSGLEFVPFRRTVNIKSPLSAVGRFGPDGLQGVVKTGPFLDPSDGILTTETRSVCGMQLLPGGEFVSKIDHALPRGEFLVGSFLSDTQRRRQEVYRQLWETKGKVPVAVKPTLFIWAKPIDLQFRIADEESPVGSALLSIPLQLKKSSPNTSVRIPPPFLPYQKVNVPDGVAATSCFNNQNREWVEKSGPSRNWLRFQLPKTVLPMTLESFTIRVHFEGRSQKLEIRAFVNGKSEVIGSYEKPAGEIKLEIKRKDLLKLDPDGGVVFGIFVGDTNLSSANIGKSARGASWKIDYVQADATGTTNDTP